MGPPPSQMECESCNCAWALCDYYALCGCRGGVVQICKKNICLKCEICTYLLDLLNVLCGSLRRCRARVCRFCIFAPRSTFSRTRLHPRANHHHHFPLYILTFLGLTFRLSSHLGHPFHLSSHLGLSFLGMPLLNITV